MKEGRKRAASLHSLCRRLELPLWAALLSAPPSTPDVVDAADLETPLSNLLAAASLAQAQKQPLLGSHLQCIAADLVCGTDLSSAQQSDFAEHVAGELQQALPSLQKCVSRESRPLSSKKNAADANTPQAAAAQELDIAWQSSMDLLPFDAQRSALHQMRAQDARASELVQVMHQLALAQLSAHTRATSRLHAGVLASLVSESVLTELMQHRSAKSLMAALEVPLPPACVGGPANAKLTKSSARGRSKRAGIGGQKAKPAAPSDAAAVTEWLATVRICAHRHQSAVATAQMLSACAASALAPVLSQSATAAGDDRLMWLSRSDDQSRGAHTALQLSLAAAQLAGGCTPASVPALQTAALAAALLQANAVASAALRRALGMANAHAALLLAASLGCPGEGGDDGRKPASETLSDQHASRWHFARELLSSPVRLVDLLAQSAASTTKHFTFASCTWLLPACFP